MSTRQRPNLKVIGIVLVLVFWALCAKAAIVIETYTDRTAFENRIGISSVKVVDFDDINTSTIDPNAFHSTHYLNRGLGIRITGQSGQWLSRNFHFPTDFVPSSSPNMYAPGPIDEISTSGAAGGNTTVVTFFDGGNALTAGFGLYFIDADWPLDGPSSFTVYDPYGQLLGTTGTIATGDGQKQFAGIITVDSDTGQPTPSISSVRIINGSGWPGNDYNEGVALDDFVFAHPSPPQEKIGVVRNGSWYLDYNGNGYWDSGDKAYGFGLATDILVVGDWNGSGAKKLGVKRGQWWYLDYNGNGYWDSGDKAYSFGLATDIPVAGDWNREGKDKIGVFREGKWYLDYNGDGTWNGCGIDACYSYGTMGDIPVVGDWHGDGYTYLGVFRSGVWYLDYDRSDSWSGCSVDRCYYFGLLTDTPIVGDWNGSGTSKIGVRRGASWYLDFNGNGSWDESVDKAYPLFGSATDKPVCGNW